MFRQINDRFASFRYNKISKRKYLIIKSAIFKVESFNKKTKNQVYFSPGIESIGGGGKGGEGKHELDI